MQSFFRGTRREFSSRRQSMQAYILRRLVQIFPVFILAVSLNFLLINLAPGDPAVVLAGDHAPKEYIEELRDTYGLNEPLHTRLGTYLGALARGDLGYSFAYRRPVLEVILERVQATLLLV